ncbi:sugar (pentulose or hexulose) kinase [Friedmanniella endophytica]|uniref:Sugar (Pentulose or hexulose) kinase n=1 Tax=Microlunatus kandeliicorticis TaxID=1759536 RepID=A0A7W3P524_9ACTN|nr:FGGY-family carbohydrate kinase [Microlunatus kandeliicorticis]MBA8793407.1 sugar (pentulose or hexulose) kinase [Microlunatus kandeliicorticis]
MADTTREQTAQLIEQGEAVLGLELGSTRIKAVLIGPDHQPLASGSHSWENQLVDDLWTYAIDDVWSGLQDCYAALAADVREQYGVELTRLRALGVSAMMHGYLALDADGELLVPFRTWRNTHTGAAVEALSEAFAVNIPHRWSVAHLFQAILDEEDHVSRVAQLTTLAGYVHWKLTGRRVLGVGDASGMFPIDSEARDYDAGLLERFDAMAAERGAALHLAELLPEVLVAGAEAGTLTADGAALLDPDGRLAEAVPLCPPEGDAGTGMVATNSVAVRTGNVSAGTSIFAMVVLEGPLSRPHHELDLVTTPAGDPVAMVHCNNGASELNAWVGLFAEFAAAVDLDLDRAAVFRALFGAALDGAADGGGLMAFNYLAGEPITGLDQGRPLFFRRPDSDFSLATFFRTQLYAAFGTLRIGMDVLHEEGVRLDRMFAHGGIFTTKGVAQRFLAAAVETPVAVGDVAAEGGAWGIAVLAAYLSRAADGASLQEFLDRDVFADVELSVLDPQPDDVDGFAAFMERYREAVPVVAAAAQHS